MSPTLLFIHGFPLDATLWREQVDGLREVAHVLAPDLRGFGSDRQPVPEVMTMEAYAEDLREFMDERGIERVVLCGLSMGGYVALAFLERWPERVEGLVLAHTRATADDEAGRQARLHLANEVMERGMEVLARGMVAGLLAPATLEQRPEVSERLRTLIGRQQPSATAAAARGMARRPDRHAVLRRYSGPTLIIVGEQDRLMPPHTADSMREAAPGAELVTLRGVGHLGCVEDAPAFNQALCGLLQHRLGANSNQPFRER